MNIKLKVVQGKLQNRRGENAGGEIRIRRSPFVIGSGDTCHMRCQSRSVSARHCELLWDEEGLSIRDLASETGTYVNDRRVLGDTPRPLATGDQLRIGRLEFEVLVETPLSGSGWIEDPMADFVSDLLVEADQEDRRRRYEDPRSRQFVAEVAAKSAAESEPSSPGRIFKRPPKTPPRKLPPPPKYVADNTTEAAEETLKKIMTPKR